MCVTLLVLVEKIVDGKESMRHIVKEEIVAGVRFILILIAFMTQTLQEN